MRYPTGLENIVRDATLSATNTVASEAWELISRDADGGGTVELAGSFDGADDAVVDIEVTSNTINGAPQLSTPVYAGIGNGLLSGLEADSGIAAQEFTVTCLSTGTPTRKAWAPFQSVNLRAQTAGEDGNALSIVVDQSGLTATATDYATTSEMSANAEEFVGEQFNFGAVNIEPEGTVPPSAPRIRFGDDVTVYRHWRRFQAGRYHYFLSPALERAVPIGTRVYAVTGGRTVSVYDGETEAETYEDIDTLYSLLAAIAADSELIEVDGVIAEDRRPGGMACDDLSVYTQSYSAGSTRDGTSYIRRAVIPLTVDADAPTEALRVECTSAALPGAEIWTVSGSVSGDLGSVTTGEAFAAGDYGFTIPIETAPNETPPGEFAAHLDLLNREDAATIPTLCVQNPRLGAEAQSRTYVFEWRPRPAASCPCDGVSVQGGPNDDLLGIDPPEETAVATLPAAIKSLYQDIADWRQQSINLNFYFTTTEDDSILDTYVDYLALVNSAEMVARDDENNVARINAVLERVSVIAKADEQDIRAITMVANFFQTHLMAIYTEMGGTGALDSEVETAFQAAFDAVVDKMTPLMVENSDGSYAWKTGVVNAFQIGATTGSAPDAIHFLENWLTREIASARNMTQNLEPLLRFCQATVSQAYIAGDLLPPFDAATLTGNSVWQDHGGTHWFVSQGDGLLPIQPGFYYHSARMETDAEGIERPVSTKEFGFGPAIGCPDTLLVGDRLIVTTTPYGNARSTYQQGDSVEWSIVRADPVALGGGQIGDDTLTFGVRGSVVGALDDYALVTTAPAGYEDGGLSFSIEPGAIAFVPGDRWTFSAEGGEFRWRIDGGGWTTADIAASVALGGSGISAVFRAGATPSWVDGDLYQLRMLSTSGAGNARTPDDESLAWTGSTQIDIAPSGAGTADTLLIALHTIPSTATVTLLGSNDNWSTTAFSQAVPWAVGSMALLFASTTCSKWRLTVNAGGSIDWLYLGVPERPIVTGTTAVEHGVWRRRSRLGTAQRTRALGGTVTHTDCTQDSIDDLLDAIEYAHQEDDGRIGAVSPEGEATLAVVDDEIELDEAAGFQPPAALRRLSLTMQLTPR